MDEGKAGFAEHGSIEGPRRGRDGSGKRDWARRCPTALERRRAHRHDRPRRRRGDTRRDFRRSPRRGTTCWGRHETMDATRFLRVMAQSSLASGRVLLGPGENRSSVTLRSARRRGQDDRGLRRQPTGCSDRWWESFGGLVVQVKARAVGAACGRRRKHGPHRGGSSWLVAAAGAAVGPAAGTAVAVAGAATDPASKASVSTPRVKGHLPPRGVCGTPVQPPKPLAPTG
jgi:hypothetical protein